MVFSIKVDYREKQLLQFIHEKVKDNEDIHVVSENIPLGDVILCDSKGREKVIIERKTMLDLANSIQDGRYKEQSFRLNQIDLHNHNIMFIIEGKCSDHDLRYSRVKQPALYSACVSLFYYEGFSLFRTYTTYETAEFIIRMAIKLNRETKKRSYYEIEQVIPVSTDVSSATLSTTGSTQASESASTSASAYIEVSKRIKKNNITPENIGEIILSQIPSISTATSKAIMQKCGGSFSSLIQHIQDDKDYLKNVTYITSNGQSRHISKTSIQNILNYLCYEKDNVIDFS